MLSDQTVRASSGETFYPTKIWLFCHLQRRIGGTNRAGRSDGNVEDATAPRPSEL
jgi:hypothetical protein